jgi:hypothetical protein
MRGKASVQTLIFLGIRTAAPFFSATLASDYCQRRPAIA